jgi:2-polyprenyl-3-methyl-5-hydroxy-6-metoxy-1,4-benzoquinol methylase
LVNMLYEQPRLYDALYDGFSEDIQFYVDLCRPGPVCELGCGSGRVSIPLSAAGISVTGVDSQPEMVAAARERAQAAGVAPDRLEFRVGDMREAQGDGSFASVIVPLHSLSHLLTIDDLLQALRSMHHSLKPGGTLALALHNPDPAYLAQRGEGLERIHRDVAELAVYEVAHYHSDTQILDLKWYVETAEETKLLTYQLRMIFPEELLLLLRSAGFEVDARYGWYDRTPFGPDSGTQIVVARRP